MAWKNFVGPLAVTSRRRAVAAALVYGLSLTVRFTSAAGDETENPAQSAQRTNPMTSIMFKNGAQIFQKDVQPIVLHHRWPLSVQRLQCGM
jgi:hypothetical protein